MNLLQKLKCRWQSVWKTEKNKSTETDPRQEVSQQTKLTLISSPKCQKCPPPLKIILLHYSFQRNLSILRHTYF